ncbi:hypothetical protein SH501x_000225 [Pirellulaceae bacterium SH501]
MPQLKPGIRPQFEGKRFRFEVVRIDIGKHDTSIKLERQPVGGEFQWPHQGGRI